MSAETDRRERCVMCKTAFNPRTKRVRVELDKRSVGPGFTIGHVCQDCADELAEKIEESADGYGANHP